MQTNDDVHDGKEFLRGLGLGCWQLGGAVRSAPDEKEAHEILREAYRLGVSHFDTAQSYGDGRSEEVIGAILPELPEARIATKIHFVESEKETLERIDASRGRLQRDTIDLVYLHWPHRGKELRPVLAGMEEARAKGWLRLIGVSNFSSEQLASGSEVARIDAHQIGYSLLWRWPESEVIPYCAAHGIAFIAYTPLAQGLLTGKIGRDTAFPADDPRPRTLYYDESVFPHVLDSVERMKSAAEAHGSDLLHAALGWVLRREGVAGAIAGVKSLAQLRNTFTSDLRSGQGPATMGHEGMDAKLTEISNEAMRFIPDIGNIFKHYP